MFHSKKSVSLVAEIMSSTKWLKFKENQESQKNDRPTFVIKWLQKREKFDLIECENSGNAVVVLYLKGIETIIFGYSHFLFFVVLYLKGIETVLHCLKLSASC